MSEEQVLGIVGGSAVDGLPGLQRTESAWLQTRWGRPSGPIHSGTWEGLRVLYLARHGEPHAIAPHRINYRANLQALHDMGATAVVAINTVGGIAAAAAPGTLWVPDQIVDYTWGRESAFGDGAGLPLAHIEFGDPYDHRLRGVLLEAARGCGVALGDGSVYACTQGPRLETAAEIRRLARDGCDLVGMTGMPEAALARELRLPYACVAMVVNRAAGLAPEPITMEAIRREAAACVQRIAQVLGATARVLRTQGVGVTVPVSGDALPSAGS